MKTRYIILAFAAAAMCCGCNEQFAAQPTGNGTLSFEKFQLLRDGEVEVVETKGGMIEASDNYQIEITDKDDITVFSGNYKTVKSTGYGVELLAGNYKMSIISEEMPQAAFSKPVYGADTTFTISVGKKTVLESIVCKIRQCGATVSYDDDLLAMMTGNGKATVEVAAGYPLDYTLTYNAGNVEYDKRIGYFAVTSDPCTMIVTFAGNVNGKSQKMTKQFTGIKIGELRNITFIKKVEEEGNVTFDIVVDGYVQDSELLAYFSAPQIDVIGEDPDAPKGDGGIKLEFAPGCTMFTDLENIVVPKKPTVMDLRLVATVPNGVKGLKVNIESTSEAFQAAVAAAGGPVIDLVNPSPDSEIIFEVVPFPHGPSLVGMTEVNFNLSAAQDPILGFPGTHSFTMIMSDSKGCRKEISIKMIVQ